MNRWLGIFIINKIIAVINQKGGVGKTTTAVNLSAALGILKQKVLLIDMDPQGNCTTGFGVQKNTIDCSIYNVLCADIDPFTAVIPNITTNVDLIPVTNRLAHMEQITANNFHGSIDHFKYQLTLLKVAYDYIFIDCSPSLVSLNKVILASVDKIIIPVQTEFYSLEGLTQLIDLFFSIKNTVNNQLDILGVLLTMVVDRSITASKIVLEVKKLFTTKVFKAYIPRNIALSDASANYQDIFQYDKKAAGAVAYLSLAKEINHGK